ncbi:MAG: transposase [Elusimicrobiales bacterium]|nr:transposase [Elusimicrobiales bacterium]
MIYHIMNKSIDGYKIFIDDADSKRFIKAMIYYSYQRSIKIPFKEYLKVISEKEGKSGISKIISSAPLINIICYVVMPNHFHILLDDFKNNYLSKYCNNLLDSYTRYFNVKYQRKGPLWQSRFKRIPVEKDQYFIHLTRYIHLNPVTAFLVDSPNIWEFSSYNEYLSGEENICNYLNYFPDKYDFKKSYAEFVNDRIDYQRKLAEIKHMIVD